MHARRRRDRLRLALLIGSALAALAGCPRSLGGAGAGDTPDASSAPTEPVNEKDATRYPYEKKLKDVSATLLKDAVVRKSPPDGALGSASSSSGASPSAPTGSTIFTQPVNGQCPAGFAKSDVGCHRKCGGESDGPAGVKCKSGMLGSTKICTTG